MRYKLTIHQVISKSPLKAQKDIACSPEEKVNAKESKVMLFHMEHFFLYKKIEASPVIDINISNGKKDQFHVTIMGLE